MAGRFMFFNICTKRSYGTLGRLHFVVATNKMSLRDNKSRGFACKMLLLFSGQALRDRFRMFSGLFINAY
jgi:hypothetical protein